MIHAIAPNGHRGHCWVLAMLMVTGLLLWPEAVRSQQQDDRSPAPAEPTGDEGTQAEQPAPAEATPPAEPDQAQIEAEEEAVLEDSVFVDPVAQQAMANTFDELHGRYIRRPTRSLIRAMARGERNPDVNTIDIHIKAAAHELTDHDNIDAVLNDGSQRDIDAIQEAGADLLEPYLVPLDQRSSRFYQEYNQRLLEVAPDLLKNHLLARTQIMVTLSRMGDPRAIDLLLQQLQDPNQPVSVKLLATVGLTTIARQAGNELTPSDRVKVAEGLVAFLRQHPETFWMARARALEALGSIRQISGIQNRNEAAFAVAALEILANDQIRAEVRAWAAWVLGMIEVPPAYPQVNYALIAYHTGTLAAELGDQILVASDPEGDRYNLERVKYLTGLLIEQVFTALDGERELRSSGLIHASALGPHRQYVTRVHQLVKRLAVSAVQLTRAVGTQQVDARDQVAADLAELKNFLENNRPEDTTLVPGSPNFAVQAATTTGEE